MPVERALLSMENILWNTVCSFLAKLWTSLEMFHFFINYLFTSCCFSYVHRTYTFIEEVYIFLCNILLLVLHEYIQSHSRKNNTFWQYNISLNTDRISWISFECLYRGVLLIVYVHHTPLTCLLRNWLYQVKCERSEKISDKILYATKDIFRNRLKRVIETGEKCIHF